MDSRFESTVPVFKICGAEIPLNGVDLPESVTIVHSISEAEKRFLGQDDNGDVTIIAGNKRLHAHEALLRARIPFFEALFNSEMVECTTGEINLSSNLCAFDISLMESMLDYAYTGRITISVANVQSMMMAARYLQMEPVMDECALFMRRRIRLDNVLHLLFFYRSISYYKDDEHIFRFMDKNFVSISRTPEFLEMTTEDLVLLLQRTSLYVDSEEQVYEAAARWIDIDTKRQGQEAIRVLKCVNLDWAWDISDAQTQPSKTTERRCDDAHKLIFSMRGMEKETHMELTVQLYDPITNTWTKCKSHECPNGLEEVAVIDHKIYIFGGYKNHSDKGVIYDTVTNELLPMPKITRRRSAFTANVIKGKIYVAGGNDEHGDLSSLENYDPSSQEWSTVSSMKKKRTSHTSCVLNNKLYVFGGFDDEAYEIWNDGECYDPETDQWTPIPPMKHSRWGAGAAALNGHIYVVGGSDGRYPERTPFQEVERYNPATRTWTTVKSTKHGRYYPFVRVSCGKLFVCGGYDDLEYYNYALTEVEMYHPETDTWELKEHLKDDAEPDDGIFIGTLPISVSLPSPVANLENIHFTGFRHFGLKDELLRAMVECDFMHISDVQQDCLRPALLGNDLICQAESSMGKTSTFVISTLQQLEPIDGKVLALVLCPTREMATSIVHEFERFSKHLTSSVKVAAFFGGTPISKDEDSLKNNSPHIIVGTPGRILALAHTGALNLAKIKHLALDECDAMIDDIVLILTI